MQHEAEGKRRIEALDLARGLALAAMAVFHFAWDLEFFGYAPAGMTREFGWMLFARSIASSFLFLVGVGLFLAHGQALRTRPFLRRLAMIAAAALLITIATRFATPSTFIFFGILHQIALASVLGLVFLRLPVMLTVLVAALVIALPQLFRHEIFDHPLLWWVGLATVPPRANDYVPLFPWFGPVLLGIAAARLAVASGLDAYLARKSPGAWSQPLQAAGRHSLAFYLLHQPVLIGGLWLFAQLVPPPPPVYGADFMPACMVQCREVQDEPFCESYCGCMLDAVETEGKMEQLYTGGDDELTEWLENAALSCSNSGQQVPEEEMP